MNKVTDVNRSGPAKPAKSSISPTVFSVPNLLTYARILAVPAIVLCFSFENPASRWTALALFVAAAITDWLDGYFARAWSQQSALGRMLDPIADKLLVSIVLLLLVSKGDISGATIWAAVIILSREILVSGLREFLAELQVSVPVSQLAKWKTGVQLVALGFLIPGEVANNVIPNATTIGIVALWASALLTIYTGYDYFRAGITKLIEES